jgi:hypothetical protein
MMEKYSCYEFEINKAIVMHDAAIHGYVYEIHTAGCPPYDDGIIGSDEWYDTEQEARFAAIGHIDLLENGEG